MPIIATYPDYKARNALTDPTGLIAAWPLDDPSGQGYSRVLNPGANSTSYIAPRNIVINGTFDTNTIWTVGTGWSITGGQAVATASAVGQSMSQSIPMTIGKAYTITYTITVTAGSIKSQAGTANGATQTASGTYTDTLICTGNTTLSFTDVTIFTGTLDNVTVTQVNIPAYNSAPTQMLADGDMEAAGTASWTAGNSATLSKQTGTPHSGSQVLRVARNGTNNPYSSQTILTIGTVYRVTGVYRNDGSVGLARVTTNGVATVLASGNTLGAWLTFDIAFVAVATDLNFGSNSTSGTQYVEFDDITVYQDTSLFPRDVLALEDGNMEQSGTSYWTASNSATVTKNASAPHSGTQNLRIARNGVNNPFVQQVLMCLGKTYRITGWFKGDGSASLQLQTGAGTSLAQTSSSSWTSIDVTFIADNSAIRFIVVTSTGTQFGEYDDFTLTEIDPLSGAPTNGVVLGVTTGANGHLITCCNFDGSNDNINVYSTSLNSVFNPSEGTLIVWAKVSGSGVWTDGLQRIIKLLSVNDGNNFIRITKSTANNSIGFAYVAGAVTKSVTSNVGNSTMWIQCALSWSKSNDQMIAFFNGKLSGSIQTGLGIWVGNLAIATTVIGAAATSGTNPFSGFINDVQLYNRALSPVEIYNEYKKNFPIYRDR